MSSKTINAGIRMGLVEARHYRRMGSAVWLFIWVVGRQTTQHGSTGLVYGGRPITFGRIAGETGFSPRTIEKWMTRLRREGYIATERTPAGFAVRVLKAKKFCAQQMNLPIPIQRVPPRQAAQGLYAPRVPALERTSARPSGGTAPPNGGRVAVQPLGCEREARAIESRETQERDKAARARTGWGDRRDGEYRVSVELHVGEGPVTQGRAVSPAYLEFVRLRDAGLVRGSWSDYKSRQGA